MVNTVKGFTEIAKEIPVQLPVPQPLVLQLKSFNLSPASCPLISCHVQYSTYKVLQFCRLKFVLYLKVSKYSGFDPQRGNTKTGFVLFVRTSLGEDEFYFLLDRLPSLLYLGNLSGDHLIQCSSFAEPNFDGSDPVLRELVRPYC